MRGTRRADEAVEELPHPRAAQRHRRADLLPLAEAEVGDRLLRLLPHRPLPGDHRQLLDDLVEQLRLLDRFAQADVEHDLLEPRNLVRVLELELLRQPLAHGACGSTRAAAAAAPACRRPHARRLAVSTLLVAAFALLLPPLLLLPCPSSPWSEPVSCLPVRGRQRVRGIASPLFTAIRSFVPSSSMRAFTASARPTSDRAASRSSDGSAPASR